MQVILQPLTDGSPVVVETNPQATVATLISNFCTQKGIAYSSKLVIFDGKKRPLPPFSTLASLGITNGQTLLIGYKESSFEVTKQWPLLVAIAALIIGVIGILTMSMVYGLTGGVYPFDYGVVMDAGSSKTNTIVYKWQSNKYKGTGCVFQEDSCNAKGGIAKMDPMQLDPVINCAKKVTKRVEASSRPKTPLYFAATGGMRLLNLTNPDRANAILEQLDLHLNETGLSVKAIEIISGRDEGIYGWITVNFLQQTLEIPQKLDPWVPTTYGALDMGGASIQISFAQPGNESNATSPDVLSMKLYGQTHNVFSHSDQCYGRDEANRRSRFLLMKDPALDTIYDPCTPSNFTLTMSGYELLNESCTYSNRSREILSKNPEFLKKTYYFKGTSNSKACQDHVAKLLDEELCKSIGFKECFKKVNNIPNDQKYIAFATYFYTTDFLNVTKSSLKEFESAFQSFCEKNYTEVLKIANNSYVTEYCFNAQYIHEILVNGFNFDNNTWENLEFVGNIADKDVGWTLGYMINATNIIPEKAKTPRLISSAALTVSLVLFILVVIATVIFLLHNHRKDNAGGSKAKSLNGLP